MEEKREAPEIQARPKWMEWLENFWYHYKWHTIVVSFFAVALIVSLVQCTSDESSDITVTYAGNYALSADEMKSLEAVFGAACPEDYDGSGSHVAFLAQYAIFNEEQLTKEYTYFDEESGEYKVDKNTLANAKYHNADRIKNLQTYIMTGECGVWLVSPYVYNEMLYSEDPRSNWVQSAKPLKETKLYAYYDALKCLPEDTIVVLTVSPAVGYMSKAENHQKAVAYFESVLNFDPNA